jgi:hypothetical protein
MEAFSPGSYFSCHSPSPFQLKSSPFVEVPRWRLERAEDGFGGREDF